MFYDVRGVVVVGDCDGDGDGDGDGVVVVVMFVVVLVLVVARVAVVVVLRFTRLLHGCLSWVPNQLIGLAVLTCLLRS